VLDELRQAWPELPVVVVSASERCQRRDPGDRPRGMGFVPKRSSNDALREALGVVMSGGLYVPPMMLGLDRGTAAAATPRRRDAQRATG
jgi:DNA-binding NarL/FixJ family response regulator